ncbi:hypothetical protein [Leisingera sp. ANG-M1]|uniref:hypothetical protein n=1 Tax=Leisingera sp. ANG-M1 TaxID=1577895 RepID=UPI00126A6F5C|nr:hypothetical protein [Leisingera sp. ANG-M1]
MNSAIRLGKGERIRLVISLGDMRHFSSLSGANGSIDASRKSDCFVSLSDLGRIMYVKQSLEVMLLFLAAPLNGTGGMPSYLLKLNVFIGVDSLFVNLLNFYSVSFA